MNSETIIIIYCIALISIIFLVAWTLRLNIQLYLNRRKWHREFHGVEKRIYRKSIMEASKARAMFSDKNMPEL